MHPTTISASGASPHATLPPCVCGARSYRLVRASERFLGVGESFEVHACQACGLARTSPPPYDDELTADVYQELPYESVTTREAEWRGFFRPLLDAAWRHRPGGRFLDVGCGVGLAVKMAAERGYEAAGVEINARSAAYARDVMGLPVVNSDLAHAGFPEGHFSVVLLSHVLEHLSTPHTVFDDIKRVLAPDGVLVVEVPNMAGLLVPVLGARWTGWMPNMHVWQFTPATLARTLRLLGFEVVEVRCRDNIEIGQPCHPVKRLLRRTVFRVMEETARVLGRGDKILCVARLLPSGRAG